MNTHYFERQLKEFSDSNYCGYDPFDALNSRLISSLPIYKSAIFRLIWLQLHKRSYINFRKLTLVPKVRNPKGIALIILGLLSLYRVTQKHDYLLEAETLVDWLLQNNNVSDKSVHAAWGYPFDWQARAFFVPKGKPNIITTTYIIMALFELYRATSKQKYYDMGYRAARYILDRLVIKSDKRMFFAYIEGEDVLVHNANLWGCASVARFNRILDFRDLEILDRCLHQSVSSQQPNGCWVYGEKAHHQFIDGFHTGYNLEALTLIAQDLETDTLTDVILKGLEFYKRSCFEDDGRAKYYADNTYPLDTHSYAQALITLTRVFPENNLELLRKTYQSFLKHMYLPTKGRFRYVKGSVFNSNINYLRWSQSWAFYSLALYNEMRLSEKN